MAFRAPPASSTPQQGGCDQAPLSNQPGGHRINRRQIIGDQASRIAFVGRTEKFARVGAEINAGRIARIRCHAFAVDSCERVLLWQPFVLRQEVGARSMVGDAPRFAGTVGAEPLTAEILTNRRFGFSGSTTMECK